MAAAHSRGGVCIYPNHIMSPLLFASEDWLHLDRQAPNPLDLCNECGNCETFCPTPWERLAEREPLGLKNPVQLYTVAKGVRRRADHLPFATMEEKRDRGENRG